ncbi:phosphatidylinositol-specific phospholipase C domain-containing protein [Fluviispira vulneris]|uniref:phosphatidylinositol-specific phospholipase C domain-containing protein n=1 Tax=Fluviispira vulneris TaxID=2763012 RepID=UPI001644D849|nr:phosphatidylinositol-specific phospholipase C domain-containing protein [Fluviispira vulneris]
MFKIIINNLIISFSILLYSNTLFAASKTKYLYINNFSNTNIFNLLTENVDNSDWDGVSRPDKNINGKSLASGQKLSEREEINTYKNTHCFNLNIHMKDEIPNIRVCLDSDWTNQNWRTLYIGNKYDVVSYGQTNDVYIDVINHVDLQNWTTNLPDSMPIAKMSIPGTHDSGTWHYNNFIMNSFVRTQRTSSTFFVQLDEGIRFFDIRVKPEKDYVWSLYHSSFYLGISFNQFLDNVSEWLNKHPSETLFVSIKEDQSNTGAPSNNDILSKYINDYANKIKWLLDVNDSTTLAHARGRLILLNRFNETPGVNLKAWPDDVANGTFTANNFTVWLQDSYTSGGSDKSAAILRFMYNHFKSPNTELKFNFMSSSTSSCFYKPKECKNSFMPHVNYAINQNSETSSGSNGNIKYFPNGVIPMDFYDVELSRFIAAMNQFSL